MKREREERFQEPVLAKGYKIQFGDKEAEVDSISSRSFTDPLSNRTVMPVVNLLVDGRIISVDGDELEHLLT